MNIYLLRHAQAKLGFPDRERTLTERGRGHAQGMGKWLSCSSKELPARIFCSPLVRAQETLSFLGAAWGGGAMDLAETMEALVPEGNPEAVISVIGALNEDVLLVGHNPQMEILASLMMTGERYGVRLVMKTGVLLRFKRSPYISADEVGLADLRWMLDPRTLSD
ncbi:MAG: Uncharacterised protein [Opitutia bacterium UBA7350]|nr:MAG: Uncharacterised protein [Opitutae bacterium UBA7350]